MEAPTDRPGPVRFASFELDVRSRELRQGGRRIRLQEQPFEILRLMLERPGLVVTREELRRRLWPEGTFVDFEHSLNAAVKRLRAALGDNADNPRFVETLPRRGYRFIASLGDAVATPAPAAALPRVVVLPFTNLSDDPGQEYFSDGLTEELITQLGSLCRGRVAVLARWSSMVFKGTTQRAREIGQALAAGYLLEGSVRCDGERVRITARLIDADSEAQLWSATYERDLSECCGASTTRLSVQTDVAAHVARALAAELAPPLTSSTAIAPAAYQAYLKGRYYWNQPGDSGLDQAISYFEQVIAMEPSFAAGHASMARACVVQAEYYRELPRLALERARAVAARAIALDPQAFEAHLALADATRALSWDWQAAESEYAQAIAINPSFESAHRAYGVMLAAVGRSDEALHEVGVACDIDPLCLTVNLSCAWVHYTVGDLQEAVARSRHTIDMDPTNATARRILAAASLQLGHAGEAVAELESASMVARNNVVVLTWLAHAKAAAGARAEAADIVARLRADARYVPPYHLALAYVGLEDEEAAFAALEDALVDRDPALANLAIEPRFAPLRSDARFAGLMAQLRIPGATSAGQ